MEVPLYRKYRITCIFFDVVLYICSSLSLSLSLSLSWNFNIIGKIGKNTFSKKYFENLLHNINYIMNAKSLIILKDT